MWDKLLNTQRLDDHSSIDNRNPFEKDYDRIVFSSAFRRLQGKTQVFSFPNQDFIHNRLTHSIEVSSVARSLGQMVAQNLNLNPQISTMLSAAALAHDIGNPPFGHLGEGIIQKFFAKNSHYLNKLNHWQKQDFLNFDGNAHGFHLLVRSHVAKNHYNYGLNLCIATLASLIKYPFSSDYCERLRVKKFGFLYEQKEIFNQIVKKVGLKKIDQFHYVRHPMVYLIEAADDICYTVIDLEDAQHKNLISYHQVESFLKPIALEYISGEKVAFSLKKVTDEHEKTALLRAYAIKSLIFQCALLFEKNIQTIAKGDMNGSLLDKIPSANMCQSIKKFSSKNIYIHEDETLGKQTLETLLEKIVPAFINNDEKILKNIPKQYTKKHLNDYQKVLFAVEFIASMTDQFALRFAKYLTES